MPPTFTNPLTAADAADPWIIYHEGFYYFTATLDSEGGLWVWKSPTLTGIDRGSKAKVDYRLGLLTRTGGPFLDPASWVKSPDPLFGPYSGPDGSVYATGHCS